MGLKKKSCKLMPVVMFFVSHLFHFLILSLVTLLFFPLQRVFKCCFNTLVAECASMSVTLTHTCSSVPSFLFFCYIHLHLLSKLPLLHATLIERQNAQDKSDKSRPTLSTDWKSHGEERLASSVDTWYSPPQVNCNEDSRSASARWNRRSSANLSAGRPTCLPYCTYIMH